MRLVRSKCCQRDVSVTDYLNTPHPHHQQHQHHQHNQHHPSSTDVQHTKNIFTRYWDDHIRMKESSEGKSRAKASSASVSVSATASATSSTSSAPAKQTQSVTFVRTSNAAAVCDANGNGNGIGNGSSIPTEWTFPPKAPTPHIYNCLSPDMMASSDKNSFKGFRKQFSGRFKRLVTRKVEHTPVIPPELKPQLKTIYVY
ncbi:myotubularin-related protein DDB_G0290005 isoform X1 [Drosophila santomea]|uniref:myotubularin-related protein DDB_G0290005 isoform X1 n=2 Tax=Drosophila santomea TaxID=129105 RepID=UPI0019545CF6|nr:myotubularin-related protein DDB_G0290005 isoform X1 [Drosophila santomea]